MDRWHQLVKEQKEKKKELRNAGRSLPIAIERLTQILSVMSAELPDEDRAEFAECWKRTLKEIRGVYNRVFNPSRHTDPPRPNPFAAIQASIYGDFPTPQAMDWLSEELKNLRKGTRERHQGPS